ncbi:hypothetical protein ABZX12_18535 [Kribbella sp. NPDC003505]|uniref:hypothetical protein n=1 Tax=Kribbella sp. NPDC003505 TaxID=3154448 RepID=UPI0033B4701B
MRLDSSIASHDKVLALLSDPSPKRWQAISSYIFALGWSGQQGTDGRIPMSALPFIHATTTTARLLVKYGLWTENGTGTGWNIKNWAERQQSVAITEEARARLSTAGRKANCVRWHGEECGCWKNESESA